MQAKTHKILSIIPGTRYLGIAIFNGLELRDWFVKSLRVPSMKEKMELIQLLVPDIIDRYSIDALAVKKIHPARTSQKLNKIVSVIKEVGKSLNLTLLEFSIDDMKRNLPTGKSNKNMLVEKACKIYPFLFSEFERERKNKNGYFTRVFEAIALGTICVNQLDSGQRKIARYLNK